MNVAFGPMIILLIGWVCASMILCLAFLRVVARQVPRMDEQMTAGCEPDLRPQRAVVLEKAKTAHAASWSKLPSPPPYSGTSKFRKLDIHSLAASRSSFYPPFISSLPGI